MRKTYFFLLMFLMTTTLASASVIKISDSNWSSKVSEGDKQTTELTVITENGYQLTQADWVKIVGGMWESSTTSLFPKVTVLDLSNCELSSDDFLSTSYFKYSNNTWKPYVDITFPSTLQSKIPGQLFENNDVLQKVTIPCQKNVITVEQHAFFDCKALKYVNIGKNVQTLKTGAFASCPNLEHVSFINGSVKTIGEEAFANDPSLTRINLPEGLEEIRRQAFEGAGFAGIHFPSTLKTIRTLAFDNCPNVTDIVISATVEYIEQEAFQRNSSLHDFWILGSDTKVDGQFMDNQEAYGYQYVGSDRNAVDLTKDFQMNGKTVTPPVLHVNTNNKNVVSPFYSFLWEYNAAKTDADKVKVMHTYADKYSKNSDWSKNIIPEWLFRGYDVSKMEQYVVRDANGDIYPTDGSIVYNVMQSGSNDPDVKDYVGWWNFQFVQAFHPGEIVPDTKLTQSQWYAVCFPFDMTECQLANTFGSDFDLVEFSGVELKDNPDRAGEKNLVLKFNEPVRSLKAGHPYFLHPGWNDGSCEYCLPSTASIAGIRADERHPKAHTTVPQLCDGNGITYTFVGKTDTTDVTPVPGHAYYYAGGKKADGTDSGWARKFWRTGDSYTGVKWAVNTAIIETDRSDTGTYTQSKEAMTQPTDAVDPSVVPTAIDAVETEQTKSPKVVYDLMGQRVDPSDILGVVIENGHKVLR